MLVVTRKVNEKIIIGENITIVVVDVGQGRVKIGIDAPRDVPVDREELRLAGKPAKREVA